jgi:hypothetical protein
MPAYATRPGASDVPELVPDAQPAPRKGRRLKSEPSTDDPSVYYADSPPDSAMAAAAIIAPAGGHAAGGQPGLGTGIAN